MMQQICEMLADSSTKIYWSHEQRVPYLVYGGNQWVGYENALSLYTKASWGYILTSALCSLTSDARKNETLR